MLTETLWIDRAKPAYSINNFDVVDFRERASSLGRKVGRGYNVLAESDFLQQALKNSLTGQVKQDARDRVIEDEFTGACEAVGSKYGGMWSSYRPWDSVNQEFRAFGASFIDMLQAGVDDMRKKVAADMPEYAFELARREAELAAEQRMKALYRKGQLDNQIFLTISPYPEEVPAEVASTLGYKPEEHLGKLRFEVLVNQVRQTIELGVAKGSVRIFQRLVENLGYDQSVFPTSTSFLEKPILLGESTDYLNTIIDFAKRYDVLLEEENNGPLYFCGIPVKSAEEKDYDQIIERQQWVREKGRGLVEDIYNLDLELAKSLCTGIPTARIVKSLRYWETAKDQEGTSLLSREQLEILEQAVNGNLMSREAAFILKKNELVRMWSMMACVVNEDRAKLMFGERFVSTIQGMVESATINDSQARYFVDQMIAQVNPIFLACGGLLSSFGGRNVGGLFSMGLSSVRESLFGESDRYGSLYFECPHASCKKVNKRNSGVLKESCDYCRKAISRC